VKLNGGFAAAALARELVAHLPRIKIKSNRIRSGSAGRI
jgi:hypothetical protein